MLFLFQLMIYTNVLIAYTYYILNIHITY